MIGRRQEIFVQMVWSTWDRVPLIDAEMQQWLWPMVAQEARRCGCPWAVVGGTADHVHLLGSLPATLTEAALLHQVKGGSSRAANAKPGALFRWQGGYGVFEVSPADVPMIEAYVRGQAEHHGNGTTLADWE